MAWNHSFAIAIHDRKFSGRIQKMESIFCFRIDAATIVYIVQDPSGVWRREDVYEAYTRADVDEEELD